MPTFQKLIAGGMIFIALTAACWWIWDMVPQLARRTVFWDYRIMSAVVAIFLFLTIAEAVFSRLWARLFPEA